MTARTTEPSSVCGRGNVRDPSADGLQMVSACEQQAGLAVALSRDEAHVRRRWVQRSRSAEARVAMWIHYRTSRVFSSQGRTPQRTPSHLRCAMSFAVSPGYTNAMGGRRAASLLGSASAVRPSQPPLSTGQSARQLLAQGLQKRAAPRTWLPLRTTSRLWTDRRFAGEQ